MYKSYRFLMNKIKQNKITFTLIIAAIAIIFSSLTILSLPVLFNYESKVTKIENNFNKKFKIYLNTNGKISYKPFPKPHLLVENASLKLSDSIEQKPFINKTNIKNNLYTTLVINKFILSFFRFSIDKSSLTEEKFLPPTRSFGKEIIFKTSFMTFSIGLNLLGFLIISNVLLKFAPAESLAFIV